MKNLHVITISATALLLGCVAEDSTDRYIQTLPGTIACPTCTIKGHVHDVPTSDQVPDGYTITRTVLRHEVNYLSHCPAPPEGEEPPCTRVETKLLETAPPGTAYFTELPLATDWAQGDVDQVTVTFTLTPRDNAAPTQYMTITGTIVELN